MSSEDSKDLEELTAKLASTTLTDTTTAPTPITEDMVKKLFGHSLTLGTEVSGLTSVLNKLRLSVTGSAEKPISKVIVMSGAGISVSAGIPDFRTPGTGLYDNLAKYKLPYPEAIFELSFFEDKPEPFFALAREMFPGSFKPTPTHYFVKLLQDKKLLKRNYTQNIDGLERIAGVDPDNLVEAHGTFASATCIDCGKKYPGEYVRDKLASDPSLKVVLCEKTPGSSGGKKAGCDGGFIKPDIVFFGERLPERFGKLSSRDFEDCDLLIVMGTSLKVQPFASLVDYVPKTCPRILINREAAGADGEDDISAILFGSRSSGFKFGKEGNSRDFFLQGDCDEVVKKLSGALGLDKDLSSLIDKDSKL